MNYYIYMQSEAWRAKRAEKLKKNKRCNVCGSTERLEVHHHTYRNLGKEKMTDLVVLCHRCHCRVEAEYRKLKAGKREYTKIIGIALRKVRGCSK